MSDINYPNNSGAFPCQYNISSSDNTGINEIQTVEEVNEFMIIKNSYYVVQTPTYIDLQIIS